MQIREIQEEARLWRAKNFPEHTADQQLIGMMEELGELAHAFLKHQQGIRNFVDDDLTRLQMEDCIGDLIIFTTGFCDKVGIDLQKAVNDTWRKVQLRDWVKDPEKGGEA